MIYNCEICNELGKEVRLTGGLCATLCAKHRNEWHEFTRESAVYKRLYVTNLEIHAHVVKGDAGLTSSVAYELLALEKAIYEESKKWIASKKGEQNDQR